MLTNEEAADMRDAARWRWARAVLLSMSYVSGPHGANVTNICPIGEANKSEFWDLLADTARGVKPTADLIDCEGASPCSTCPDKRECGRAGCVRIAQLRNAMNADAGSAAVGGVKAPVGPQPFKVEAQRDEAERLRILYAAMDYATESAQHPNEPPGAAFDKLRDLLGLPPTSGVDTSDGGQKK